jgi:class 3 adenylate cyclase/alpha-beta hydrolase superfamily lysophospholipase
LLGKASDDEIDVSHTAAIVGRDCASLRGRGAGEGHLCVPAAYDRRVEPGGGEPQTRFVETDLGYLAYQVFGAGSRDLLFITGGVSNIDAMWDEPSAVRFFDRLSGLGRVVQFDMRGSGVSDPVPGVTQWLPLDSYVADAVAVLDAAGVRRCVVYGDTEGGLTALLLAATHPERVSALVLVNSAARVLGAAHYPVGFPREVAEELSRLYTAQHGTTGAMLELTAPTVADDARFRSWWTRYQRLSVPLGLVRRTFDWFAEVDVRAALPLIQAPTLVIARRDAQFHRPTFGSFLAEHIPGAQMRLLDGADTLPFHAGDVGVVLDEVEAFLTGHQDVRVSDRVLATVLFTDIVGSTDQAATLGDQRWLDLLGEHDRIARAQLARFGGREIKMTGDGCLATFEAPSRAVGCADAIERAARRVGLTVRAGLHTGEVEFRSGDVGGLAVHIAARVMAHADRGGVLVSGTVKDLVVGSGLTFTPRGTVTLRGVPGQWELHELDDTHTH